MGHPTKPIKVGILGCGAISELYYTPALKELEKNALVQVGALFDPNPSRIVQLKKTFPAATSIKDLAELPNLNVDLAIVASPVRYHAEQAIQVLKSGIPVLCEKPMAATVAEGEAMIEAASAARQILAVGLFRRFFPAIQSIREMLSLKVLGEVKSFYFSEGRSFRWPAQSASFFQKSNAQGGVLLDIGVHVLDILVWWLGQPTEVFYEDDAMGGLETNCRIKLKFAQGFAGEVRISRDCLLPNRYIIQAEKGWMSWNAGGETDTIQVGYNDAEFALNSRIHKQELKNMLPSLGTPGSNHQQSFVNQLRNVVAAVEGTTEVMVPGDQGLESLRLIESCYRHRTLMHMPWLSEQESARASKLTTQWS